MHINAETEELDQGLRQGFDALSVGGDSPYLLSLLRRSQGEANLQRAQPTASITQAPTSPPQFAETPGRLVGGAIKPGLAELNANPRSRSATLRVIERVR